jgi:hypothetical protein
MGAMKRAMIAIQELGWPLTNESLAKYVKLQQKLKKQKEDEQNTKTDTGSEALGTE